MASIAALAIEPVTVRGTRPATLGLRKGVTWLAYS